MGILESPFENFSSAGARGKEGFCIKDTRPALLVWLSG